MARRDDFQKRVPIKMGDFSVMDSFLSAGLIDAAKNKIPQEAAKRLTIPTGIWNEEKTPPTKGRRIDFILTSKALAQNTVRCQIIREGVVNKISDHYPVIADFKN